MNNSVRQRTRPVKYAVASDGLIFDETDTRRKRSPPLLTNKTWFLILFCYFSVFVVVLYCDVVRFPSPVSVDSLKNSQETRSLQFSEERALNFVRELSGIGPKPTGSYENEVAAVDYILRQLEYIKNHAKRHHKIDIDLQKATGCFDLECHDGMTSCYRDVKNIVARIGPVKATNRSIIINCHFDSAPTSPGASDNVVSCAIMFEVLIALSQSDQPLHNEILFLFNGAEENVLQAAHGFITQHAWAKTAVGFINMEACGAGGKQMLFQADRERTWLLMAFTNGAPFPQGSVVAQDIFQNKLIPSDTDYRIFAEFGKIPGLDFAYVKNGYVYHTAHDVPAAITEGAVQQAGINLLHLIHNALSSSDMTTVENQTKMPLVFFDFMGLFMVVYRISVATAINFLVVIISIGDIVYKSYKTGTPFVERFIATGKTFCVLLFSLCAACAMCATIAIVLDVFNATMSWYSSPHLLFGLYGCSSLVIMILVHSALAQRSDNLRDKWLKEDVHFDAARLVWISLLVVMELCRINSSYICCAWVLFPTVVRSIFGNGLQMVGTNGSRGSHIFIHISMQIIPLCLLFYCTWSMYTVFIPIMGRIGAGVNPDLLIGLFTTLLAFLSTSYMFSLLHVMSSPRQVIMLLSFVVFITLSLVCFTPIGFPYSGDLEAPTPMRVYILHTERTFHKKGSVVSKDAGYWILPLDYNGPKMLRKVIPEMGDLPPVDCDAELACGMPFYMPVISLIRKSYYLPSPKPKIHATHKFEMVSKVLINPHTYRLSFVAQGPDHMTVIMSPRHGVELSKWSLTDNPPKRSLDWKDRPTYFIFYSYAEYTEPWTFSIDLSVSKDYIKDSPLLDLSFITHFLHGSELASPDLLQLLKRVPSWIHATPWTCTLDMYEL